MKCKITLLFLIYKALSQNKFNYWIQNQLLLAKKMNLDNGSSFYFEFYAFIFDFHKFLSVLQVQYPNPYSL